MRASVAAVLLAILVATAGLAGERRLPAAPTRAAAVAVVGMTVTDLPRAVRFYAEVLGFETIDEVTLAGPAWDRLWGLVGVHARRARMRLGREEIELVAFDAPRGRFPPVDARSDDRTFQHVAIVVTDVDAAWARVRAHVTPISVAGPETLPGSNTAAAGITAVYFRDPDGHPLELIHFPPDKGDPRWQRGGDRLFLGIDHTAIGVRATAASLGFYRDLLGFDVVGGSFNAGAEQARLTGVAGARVRITSLRPHRGLPGIELLDYREPGGRTAAPDTRPNDVLHRYTRVLVPDVDAAAGAVHDAAATVVALRDPSHGPRRAALVHDPDGHAVELVEEHAKTGTAPLSP